MIKLYQKKILLVAAIMMPPLYILYCIYHYGVPAPYYDSWEFVPLVEKMFNHDLRISDLWIQLIGEPHRGFFPKAILITLAYLTDWNIHYELYINFILVGITLLLLYSLLRKTFPSPVPTWLAIAFSAILFSTWQWENWMWGWQIHLFLCVLAVVIAVWSLDRWPGKLRGILIALAAAVIASYSYALGLLTWVVVLPLLLQKEARNWRHLSLWAIAFAGTVCLFSHNLIMPANHSLIGFILNNIPVYIMYIFIYLGTPFFYSPGTPIVAFLMGIIIVIVVISIVITVMLRRKQDIHLLLPWLVFIGFVFLSACETSIGRANLGLFMPFSSRYTTISNLLILSLFVIIAATFNKTNANNPQWGRRLLFSFLFVSFILNSVYGHMAMRANSRIRNTSWLALQSFPDTPDTSLLSLCATCNIIRIRSRAEVLSRLGIIHPGSEYSNIREEQDKINQAISQVHSSFKSEPQNPRLYIKLAESYYNNNNMEQAIAMFKKALTIDRRSLQISYNMVDIYTREGRFNEAIALLQMLEETKYYDANLDYRIACLYSRQGKTGEAECYFLRAITKGIQVEQFLQPNPDLDNLKNTLRFKKFVSDEYIIGHPGLSSMMYESINFTKMVIEKFKNKVHM